MFDFEMTRKKSNIGKKTRKTRNYNRSRYNKSKNNMDHYRQYTRLQTKLRRQSETEVKKQNRLEENFLYKKRRKRDETMYQKQIRNDLDRVRKMNVVKKKYNDWTNEAFKYNSSINYCEHPIVSIGDMNLICVYCNALKFPKEPPGMCCSKGKIFLEPLNEPPEPLYSYISGSKFSINLIKKYYNVRKYIIIKTFLEKYTPI